MSTADTSSLESVAETYRNPCSERAPHPWRIGARASVQPIERSRAASVDDVRDAVPSREALVVVVVPREDELDAVALEERHPAAHDVGVPGVTAARVRRMVEERDLPGRRRRRELLLQPPRLPGRDRVRVEEEELDVSELARVVAPGHAERLQLVGAAPELVVVVAEHAADPQARPTRPAERRLPVRPELRGALQVVVVAERDEHARGMPRLEALHAETERLLTRAADAVVARRQEPDLRLGGRRPRQDERQAEEKRNAAQGRRTLLARRTAARAASARSRPARTATGTCSSSSGGRSSPSRPGSAADR